MESTFSFTNDRNSSKQSFEVNEFENFEDSNIMILVPDHRHVVEHSARRVWSVIPDHSPENRVMGSAA